MSEPRTPGDVPPDLPPEYAEAYRRGYERAYQEAVAEATGQPVAPAATDEAPPAPPRPLFADEPFADDEAEPTQVIRLPEADAPAGQEAAEERPPSLTVFEPVRPVFDDEPIQHATPAAPLAGGSHAAYDDGHAEHLDADFYDEPDGAYDVYDEEDRGRPGWWVPALLGGLVLLLVLGAYGIGRVFSSSVDDADVSAEKPDGVVLGEDGDGAGGTAVDQPAGAGEPAPGSYRGRTETAVIGGATASCQSPDSVDAAGNKVGYPPTSAYDGDLTTAWRCNGTGVGQALTLTLAEPVRVGEVGLVPGYAKTDPRSGVDRYAENNRVTRVRWTFSDGSSVVQRLDGSPTNRALQSTRVPATQSDQVVLEVLASVRGPRNTMAVSEVRIGRTAE